MAVLDISSEAAGKRIGGKTPGRKTNRWPDRIDQQYLARLLDEGRLTERDVVLFDWLADVRCATRDQIARLFFGSDGTARNRLAKLYRMRLIERGYMPMEDAGGLGLSPFLLVYSLGRGGRYWLNQREGRKFREGWKLYPPEQMAHDLMSTELVIAIYEDLQRIAGTEPARIKLESEVVFWKLDATGKPELKKVMRKGETVSERIPLLRSDMVLKANIGPGDDAPTVLAAFVEADRGTMTNPQFAEKVRAYNEAAAQWRSREAAQAIRSGAAQPFPQVLVVTTGPNRAKHLAQTISENAGEGVVWAVIDWERLRGLAGAGGALAGPVWWKAAQGRVAANRVLLPTLAKQLRAGANNDTAPG